VLPLTFLLPEFCTLAALRSVVPVLELALPVAGLVVAVPAVFVDALPVVFAADLFPVFDAAFFCCAKLSAGILITAINKTTRANQIDLFPFLI
jgi:hypothetical protein